MLKNIVSRLKSEGVYQMFSVDGRITANAEGVFYPFLGPFIGLLIRVINVQETRLPAISMMLKKLAEGYFELFLSLEHKPEFNWSADTLPTLMKRKGFVVGRIGTTYFVALLCSNL